MHELTRYVGLDVHKDTIVIAVAERGREPARVLETIPHDLPRLRKRLSALGDPGDVAVCYEAGPTGYELVRALRAWGHEAQVVTASKTPRAAGGRRIKTDARDAHGHKELRYPTREYQADRPSRQALSPHSLNAYGMKPRTQA